MPTARITVRDSEKAAAIAAQLRQFGYDVEISRDFADASPADLQLAVFPLSPEEALERARDVAIQRGCDLFIAPGVVKVAAPAPQRLSVVETTIHPPLEQQSESAETPPEPMPVYQNPAVEPEVSAYEDESPQEVEAARPNAAAEFVRRSAAALAVNTARGWERAGNTTRKLSATAGGHLANGAARSAEAIRAGVPVVKANLQSVALAQRKLWANAAQRWQQNRAARAAPNEARRLPSAAAQRIEAESTPQPVFSSSNAAMVSPLPAELPAVRAVPRGYSRRRDVQMAFVGAGVAAFLIMIFFGAFNTPIPAATSSSASGQLQQGMPFGAVTLHPLGAARPLAAFNQPRRIALAPAKPAVAKPVPTKPVTSRPHRIVRVSSDDGAEQEVIVRHFGQPVAAKANPSAITTKDGVKHYSDDQ